MVSASPMLRSNLEVIDSRKTIYYKKTNSYYRVLSADAFRAEGLNIHGLLFDELHAQRDRRLWACAFLLKLARRKKTRRVTLWRCGTPATAFIEYHHGRR